MPNYTETLTVVVNGDNVGAQIHADGAVDLSASGSDGFCIRARHRGEAAGLSAMFRRVSKHFDELAETLPGKDGETVGG